MRARTTDIEGSFYNDFCHDSGPGGGLREKYQLWFSVEFWFCATGMVVLMVLVG